MSVSCPRGLSLTAGLPEEDPKAAPRSRHQELEAVPYLEGLAPSPSGSCYEDPNSDTSWSPGSSTHDTSRSSSVVSWGLETEGTREDLPPEPSRCLTAGTGRVSRPLGLGRWGQRWLTRLRLPKPLESQRAGMWALCPEQAWGWALVTAAEPMATLGIGFQGQGRDRPGRDWAPPMVREQAWSPLKLSGGGAIRGQRRLACHETLPQRNLAGSDRLSLTPQPVPPRWPGLWTPPPSVLEMDFDTVERWAEVPSWDLLAMIPQRPQEGQRAEGARRVTRSPTRGDTAGQKKDGESFYQASPCDHGHGKDLEFPR
ncbi:Hypothetical predicted protein [Marmota monax]|uniref:Uncharacterized protein n=1 Tax=Marmota monax TaxID=9995 RepID=A0A5E4BTR9_MARMO|nr:Hypothetical predicted protein [Marmota monax]